MDLIVLHDTFDMVMEPSKQLQRLVMNVNGKVILLKSLNQFRSTSLAGELFHRCMDRFDVSDIPVLVVVPMIDLNRRVVLQAIYWSEVDSLPTISTSPSIQMLLDVLYSVVYCDFPMLDWREYPA